jgi:hypothetical protein
MVISVGEHLECFKALRDLSINYVKVLAEVLGCRVKEVQEVSSGPELIIEDAPHGDVQAVMFVRSEIGNAVTAAAVFFNELAKEMRPPVNEYKRKGAKVSLTIITDAPKRLVEYVRNNKQELSEKMGFEIIEGFTLFIVPALLVKEAMPAVLVRALGAVGRYA